MSNYNEIRTKLKKAFSTGKTRSIAWRKSQLKGIKQFVKDKENDIVEALRTDLGRCKMEAIVLETCFLLLEIDHMISQLDSWVKPQYTQVPALMQPATSEVNYEPFGVCFIMGAFNYPVYLTLSPLAGAFAAGNCVLLKPSELSSATEKLLQTHLPAYLDPDCFAIECGSVKETTALLALQWDKIFFTGSNRVGKIVCKAAAEFMTPVTLELGGKSPAIVDESVDDLELAVKRIMWGKFANAGQTCVAPDYIYCHEKHYDEIVKLVPAMIKSFYGDNPQNSDLGRCITTAHCERLKEIIADTVNRGGKLLCGGNVDVKDKYVEPTVFIDVKDQKSRILQEEIFGPVTTIMKYKSLDEVISFVNDPNTERPQPLSLYIFAKDRANIDKLSNAIPSGAVSVNEVMFHVGNMYAPFGGVGSSGMGFYHGKRSMECFSHQRSVLRRDDHKILDVPVRYPPYSKFSLDFFLTASKIPALPIITKEGFQIGTIFTVVTITAVAIAKFIYKN